MARSIAADLAPRKIRVNVVAPGTTKTPIWKRGGRANATAEESAKVSDFFSSTVPLARWGEPEDLAKAVLFLASDDSSYINAAELIVDGGLTGAPFGAPILRGDRRAEEWNIRQVIWGELIAILFKEILYVTSFRYQTGEGRSEPQPLRLLFI